MPDAVEEASQRLRRIPPTYEFSPGQVDLTEVLHLVQEHSGKRPELLEALRRRYFSESATQYSNERTRREQQLKRAGNVLIGLSNYDLFDSPTAELTPVGQGLLSGPDDERAKSFAKHILINCWGMDVLRAIRSIQARGETVSKASLQVELERDGFDLPRATTNHTMLLKWLRAGGVLDEENVIDEELVRSLTGATTGTSMEWLALPPAQQAFVRALRQLSEGRSGFLDVARVVDQAKRSEGARFREDQIRATILSPLAEKGWIELPPRGVGRGSRSGTVAASSKLLEVELALLTGFSTEGIPTELRERRNTPVDAIYSDIALSGDSSAERHKKGIALELLTLRIAYDLGLQPLHFRLRGTETGGAELDLVAEAKDLHFTRWLFQCKNTRTVHVADLAKEVGNAAFLRAHVVVMVSTGRFSPTLTTYAEGVAASTELQVILVDGVQLQKYREHGEEALLAFFKKSAARTRELKQPQLASDPGYSAD